MPTQPPRFGVRPGAKQHVGSYRHKRIRGRAGVKLRQRVRMEEPMCRLCLAAGRTRATEEVDHIKPLSAGGSNDRSNFQGLCKPCHFKKSAREKR